MMLCNRNPEIKVYVLTSIWVQITSSSTMESDIQKVLRPPVVTQTLGLEQGLNTPVLPLSAPESKSTKNKVASNCIDKQPCKEYKESDPCPFFFLKYLWFHRCYILPVNNPET